MLFVSRDTMSFVVFCGGMNRSSGIFSCKGTHAWTRRVDGNYLVIDFKSVTKTKQDEIRLGLRVDMYVAISMLRNMQKVSHVIN